MNFIKYLTGGVLVLYPLLVFSSLVIFHFPTRYLSGVIILFAVVYFLLNIRNVKGKKSVILFISPAILITIGVTCLVTSSPFILKMYPAVADLAYLTIFSTSMLIPPPMVAFFVEILDSKMSKKLPEGTLEAFCRKATIVWCVFFVIDGLIAVITTFFIKDDLIWGIYNGGITYGFMGLIFVGEFAIIKMMERKQRRAVLGNT